MYEEIVNQSKTAVNELLEIIKPESQSIFVVGCSSSEIVGGEIGKLSTLAAAEAVFSGIFPVLKEHNIFLAAQCCEHLNRGLVIEKECAKKYNLEIVSVIPQPKAGGSFATTAYKNFLSPVVVENIKADFGMDIGDTLIGMHLKAVAVPLRLSITKIGKANLVCAYSRPKFIGGERAIYK